MKSIYFVAILAMLLFSMNSDSCAQKISTLESLGNQVEKLWEVTIPIAPTPNVPSGLIYAVLKNGIAALSPDGQTIYCYDFNGQLKWQAPGTQSNSFYGSLQSSVDGEYLYLSYAINEDVFTSAVYNAEGQLLWTSDYDSPFSISPSGKYLIALYDALDQSMSLTVLDLATGKMLWKVDRVPPHFYWQAAAGQNDKIIYYNGGKLKLFQLEDGKLLWEKSVEFESRADLSNVHISNMGNVISFNCFLTIDNYNRLRSDPKSIMYIFDEDSELLWHRVKTITPQKSNGGRVEGISHGGEYIAISDGARFSFYDIKTQKELWMIIENGLNLIAKFTKNILAFYPRISPASTKLITLKENGNIDNNHTLAEFIDFRYEQQANLLFKTDGLSNAMPIVVKKTNGQFVLEKFSVKLETIR